MTSGAFSEHLDDYEALMLALEEGSDRPDAVLLLL